MNIRINFHRSGFNITDKNYKVAYGEKNHYNSLTVVSDGEVLLDVGTIL